jgi:hypothetical protein
MILDNIFNNVKDGDIILMHDLYETTAEAAKIAIPKLIEMGYQLVTIDELSRYKELPLTAGKQYTIEASALQENNDNDSMSDQFLTEPAVITVEKDKIKVNMTWHGTEFITMDMLEELKLKGADGEFREVERSFDEKDNTLAISFETKTIEEASVFQVYVPRGMGDMRPKLRLIFDADSLKESVQQADSKDFADNDNISTWARESVYKMKDAGILSGKTGNMFNPEGMATRAEVATVFVNFMGWDK